MRILVADAAPAVVTKAVTRAADRLELSNRVLAGMLGLSERTVQRDWETARAWLHKELAAPTDS